MGTPRVSFASDYEHTRTPPKSVQLERHAARMRERNKANIAKRQAVLRRWASMPPEERTVAAGSCPCRSTNGVSGRRERQLRSLAEGRCTICGAPGIDKSERCAACYQKLTERRQRQRGTA